MAIVTLVKVLYISPYGWRRFYIITSYYICFNLLTANPTKWSNTFKQFFGNLPTNRLSMFDHFVKLALKGLRNYTIKFFIVLKSTLPWKTFRANKNSRFQQTFSCLKAIIESLEKDVKKIEILKIKIAQWLYLADTDVLDVLWTSYVRSIYVLCQRGIDVVTVS